MSQVDLILSRLDKVRSTGANRWTARCPAHDDNGPSLSIRDVDGKILLHCFAECEKLDILAALGIEFTDLFPDPLPPSKSIRKPFPAADVLDCIAEESKIVHLVGQAILEGKTISSADWERLKVAVARLEAAQEVANG